MILVPAKTFREIINICRSTTANSIANPMQSYIKLECDGKYVKAISFNDRSYSSLQVPTMQDSEFMIAFIKPVAVERETAVVRVTDPAPNDKGGAMVKVEQLNDRLMIISSVEIAQPAGTFVVPSEARPKQEPVARIWVNPKYLKDILTGLTKSDRRKAVSIEIFESDNMLMVKTSQHDAEQLLCGMTLKNEP